MFSSEKVRSAFFYVFVLVYVLDPVAFSFQLVGIPKVPFGFLGMVTAIFLMVIQSVRAARNKISPSALSLACAYFLLAGLAVFSRYFELPDVWVWVKNTAQYFLGAYAGAHVLRNGLERRWQFLFLFSVCLSGFLWFAFADRIFVSQEVDSLNYLHVSDSIALVSLVLLSSLKSIRSKIVVLILVLLSLYFVGSRFGLIAVFVASLVMLLKDMSWMLRAGLATVVVIGGVGLVGYVSSLGLEINDNRIVRLFLFTEDDTSLNARIEDNELSRDVFFDNPLLGGGYKFYIVNGEGNYPHNALSVVYEFGFFGALFLLAVGFFIFINFMKTLGGQSEGLAFAIIVFLLLACFSKFYLWWGYFVFVGYLTALRDKLRKS